MRGEVAKARKRNLSATAISYLITLFVLLAVNFFIPRLMPGGPVEALVGGTGSYGNVSEETIRAAAHYYRLDLPLIDQFGHYLKNLAQGDLGVSIGLGRPVSGLIADALPWTLAVSIPAIVLGTVFSTLLGIHAGWKQRQRVDPAITAATLGVRSIPPFFLATLASFIFSVKLGWFPIAGEESAFSDLHGFSRLADLAYHLVLPVMAMAVPLGAFQYLLVRSSMVSETGADYLLAGKAKGLTERRLKYRYAARNAMLAPLTQIAGHIGFALTGAALIETVFAYPGMGRLMRGSIATRDYPLMQGCFLVLTLGVLTVNLVVDLLYPRVDPRTSVEE